MKYLLISTILLFSFSVKGQDWKPVPIVVGNLSANNYQVVFPLGWSKNGVFAFVQQDINVLSTAEIYSYQVVFQNMKSDEILWKKAIEYDLESDSVRDKIVNIPSDEIEYNPTFFEHVFWKDNRKEIERKLKDYDIYTGNSSFLKSLEAPGGTSSFHNLSGLTFGEIIRKAKELTASYHLKLYKNNRYKQVYQFDCKLDNCKEDNAIWSRSFSVMGAFKSPFEERIAILIFKYVNGFEETWEYPFFVGADLEKGFKEIGCKR